MNPQIFYHIISLIIPLPFGCAFLYILTKDWRFSTKKSLFIILIFTIAALTAATGFYTLFGMTPASKGAIAILNWLLISCCYLILSKFSQGRSLFICFNAMTFILSILVMGEIIAPQSELLRLLSRFALFCVVLFLLVKFFRHPLSKLTQEFNGGWYQLTMIPLMLSTIYLIILVPGTLYHSTQLRCVTTVLVCSTFFIYLSLYHIFSTLKFQFLNQANYAILKEQMISLQKQTETTLNINEQMSIFRHDVRHFIQLLKASLQCEDISTAEDILETMNQKIISIDSNVQHFTGNILVDAILSNYEERTHNAGITLDINLSLTESLEADPVDFAIVIANGLENAFNACMKIPKEENRIIKLTGRKQARIYLFSIENTYTGHIHFHSKQHIPLSPIEGHGYGTRSILSFAEKHNAFIDFTTEDGWFILRLIFM